MTAITTTAVTAATPDGPLPLPRPALRDVVKTMGFFAPWAGRSFTVGQAAIATRIPPRRLAGVLAWLVAGGWLQQGRERWGEPTWIRIDGRWAAS